MGRCSVCNAKTVTGNPYCLEHSPDGARLKTLLVDEVYIACENLLSYIRLEPKTIKFLHDRVGKKFQAARELLESQGKIQEIVVAGKCKRPVGVDRKVQRCLALS